MAGSPADVIDITPPADIKNYEHATVIIVGAGPVGLFLALKLSQQGVDVLILDSEPHVLQSPRATTYIHFSISQIDR